ncbi:MAG: cytochrome c oxidase subunit 3 [Candidatus Portiera sp.]|nr:cytochrome c oxidase subunit 3 [Portiera sp.]
MSSNYYVPAQSKMPLVASIGLFTMMFSFGHILNAKTYEYSNLLPTVLMGVGFVSLMAVVVYWFKIVIWESRNAMHSNLMDKSYRWSMGWFISTEVMFFATFFGVLFYVRYLAVPWLSSEGAKEMNILLWPDFIGSWPLFQNPDPEKFPGPKAIINPLQVPLLNTIILVTSSFTLTWAHHALRAGKRLALRNWLMVTILLGISFLSLQVEEYIEAYTELDLTFDSGIYANTFFLLTGFHGAHVTLGTIMLITMLGRVMKGHFTANNHFAFEASSWYWHFVDVVWIGLFLFVYIL